MQSAYRHTGKPDLPSRRISAALASAGGNSAQCEDARVVATSAYLPADEACASVCSDTHDRHSILTVKEGRDCDARLAIADCSLHGPAQIIVTFALDLLVSAPTKACAAMW